MHPNLIEYLRYNLTDHLASMHYHDSALLGGSFGEIMAMFMLNRQLALPQDEVERYLDKTIEGLPFNKQFPTYCNGLAGMGIGLMLLNDYDLIDLDDTSLESFDSYLSMWIETFMTDGNYDLFHGATGIAMYFVKRSSTAPETSSNALTRYLSALDRDLVRENNKPDGCTWCKMKHDFSAEERNISMSHGLAGIVNVLAQIYATGLLSDDNNKKTKGIIESLIATILKQRIDFAKYRSSFPSYYKSTEAASRFSRLAWCYGDIGILASLSMVADLLSDNALASRIEPMVMGETSRRKFEHTYIRDACICHGASGIYAYFSHASEQYPDNVAIRDASSYWENYILCIPREYLCYDPIAKEYNKQYSILSGYAGIALALIDDKTVINKLLLYEKM